MKQFLWLLQWTLKAAIFLMLFAFALNNQEDVQVRFFWGLQWTSPLVLVLLAFFAAGLVLGVLGRQSELFRASSEEDIEGVFRLILKLLPLMTPSEHDAVIDAMAAAVTSTAADKPLVRLKM